MRPQTAILGFLLLSMIFGFAEAQTFNLKPGEVNIEGFIEDFKGDIKTGHLGYFDAITRLEKDVIFSIDNEGRFSISFELIHPTFNACFIEFGDYYYSGFYLEPDKKYLAQANEGKLQLLGESTSNNKIITAFNDSLWFALNPIMEEEQWKHVEGLPVKEYLNFQKEFEQQKFEFLQSYLKIHPLSSNIVSLLKNEIKFKTAHAWINYRFDYSTGRPVERDSLPENFYKDLFSLYPINSFSDCQSRYCNDYISNIVTVLTNMSSAVENRIDFYRSFKWFTENDLNMIAQRFQGNEVVEKSEDYVAFNTKGNSEKLRDLHFRFCMHSLLENIHLIPEGIGRSLVISQGISRNYLDNNYSPSPEEWEKIEKEIPYTDLLKYLKNLFVEETITSQPLTEEDIEINSSIDEVLAKYIHPYKGKVIYIDFYATWCGPCREEVPYAKTLFMEMEGMDIIFLNLCAQSRNEDWQKYVSQRGIEGENFLLSTEEYVLLSKHFNVRAFPTYILIDKRGSIANKNASRPSSGYSIEEEIMLLLN